MRVDFYHLSSSPVERTLPQLLERILKTGERAVVMAASQDRLEALSNTLWTYSPNSWLPHGSVKDGFAAQQPVWLTDNDENPNGAKFLVLMDGMSSSRMGEYDRCLDIFDGNVEPMREAARDRWKAAKAAGHELRYWQQDEVGKWAEKGA